MNATVAVRSWPRLRTLLGPAHHASAMTGEGDPGWLTPEEAAQLGNASARRRREFAAGRACARHALHQAGVPGISLPINGDRQPRWPAAFTGSISHAPGLCIAAVAPRAQVRALGIDTEPLGRVSAELWPQICTADETAWLARMDPAQRDLAQTLVFCAKEAFYKCQFAVTGRWLEFRDVALDLKASSLERGCFVMLPVSANSMSIWTRCPDRGRFAVFGRHLIAAVSLRH